MHCDNTKTSSDIEHVDWSTGTGSGHHYANVRFGSGSSQASQSSGDICRICHCESDPQNPLLTPCYCAGSLKYVHQACLQQWLTASETNSCELCKFPFIMHTKIKPFNEWRSLDISGIERRRLCCSVLFHFAAALCVIWSLCVLIERAAEDVQRGLIDWPFWTKLAVVTVGLTGGVVFMYIQCKAYLHLCHRWKARNRILLIQNAPEKVHPLSQPSPTTLHRNLHEGTGNEARTSGLNAAAGAVEIGANVSSASNPYNYVSTAGVAAAGANADGNVQIDGVHHHHHHLSSSPHLLPQADLDLDPLALHSSSQKGEHHLVPHHQLGQVAVSANIECSQSQHNYERDWALDDVISQISSFRPCPQGSGSMTPFHDSIHNVLEHSENSNSSRGGSVNDICGGSRQDLSTGGVSSDTGREHAMQLSSFSGSGEHKAPSISSGVSHAVANGLGGFAYKPHHHNAKRYSNSSIFLENRDILNDSMPLGLESSSDYSNMNYRHSAILTPTDIDDVGDGVDVRDNDGQLEKFLGADLRRYSDTKLLASNAADAEAHEPMLFNRNSATAADTPTRTRLRNLLKQHSANATDTVLDMELPTSPLSPPAAYAEQREHYHHPSTSSSSTLRHSMQTVEAAGISVTNRNGAIGSGVVNASGTLSTQQIDKARLFFKSLPNLSSSCESLIKK